MSGQGCPSAATEFEGADVPPGFGGPADHQWCRCACGRSGELERSPSVRTLPNVERRFYFFAPDDLPAGTISLTLYRCPDADTLSPATARCWPIRQTIMRRFMQTCGRMAFEAFTGWGQTSWHGLPFGIYSIIYSGLVGPGEGAAIPELKCISPERCLSGSALAPRAPTSSSMSSRSPLEHLTSDGDGFTDRHERAGGTDPADSSSPGPDRVRSGVDTDTGSFVRSGRGGLSDGPQEPGHGRR